MYVCNELMYIGIPLCIVGTVSELEYVTGGRGGGGFNIVGDFKKFPNKAYL